jgi:Tetratricopeptide repeat
MPDAQQAICDDFAKGEVRRLGESVPAALGKGFLTGLTIDIRRGSESPYVSPMHASSNDLSGVFLGTAAPLFAVFGAVQRAQDAERTNEEVYGQAIRTCTEPAFLAQTFGPRDARVATSLEVLADCYMRQGKYAKAEPLRREAAAIWEAVFGPFDSTVARALDDHAIVLRDLHRAEEADTLSSRAAFIRIQLASPVTHVTAETPKPSGKPLCDSPVHAALFVRCRQNARDANADTRGAVPVPQSPPLPGLLAGGPSPP